MCGAVTMWFVHATVHSIVESPAHLHFVVEPSKRDKMAWQRLQEALDPKLVLAGSLLLALMLGVLFGVLARAFEYLGFVFGFAIVFVGISLALAGSVVFIMFMRLLSAGHARMMANLEQNIAQLICR